MEEKRNEGKKGKKEPWKKKINERRNGRKEQRGNRRKK